ncbi:hypothetical protein CMI47_11780 [Candidatus Pacearchaeota archaeon]|nr:hypothetical protein [Candidatus Pacearchaeota archaeon]|tara:strand:- start:1717 stop:3162 length:1446 start_codon:yes stop_codon:yes gene_type:complete
MPEQSNAGAHLGVTDQSAWWLSATVWAVEAQRAPLAPVPYRLPEWMAESALSDRSVAYVHVAGVLTPHGYWGCTYDKIKMQLNAAAADPEVTKIVLVVDSPGGDAAGVAGAAAAVQAAAEQKPVIAHVDGLCCSAAYWLASQAHAIVATETSLVGSIGAILTAYSMDRLLKEVGIDKVTMRSEGAPDKALNPAESKRGRELDQKLLNDLEAQFHAAVAEGRGVDVSAVQTDFGKGAVFVAGEGDAIKRGLIDQVGSLTTALNYDDGPAPFGGYGLSTTPADSRNGGPMAANKRQSNPTPDAGGSNTTADADDSKIQSLEAQIAALTEEKAELAAERDRLQAEAKTAKDLAASNGSRLATAEADLKEMKAELAEQKAARLKAEEDSEIKALADGGYLVGEDEARARRLYAAQYRQGVEGVFDDFKAAMTDRGPVVDTKRRTHSKPVAERDPSIALDEKIKAYMAKHQVDYRDAYNKVSEGQS